ncbi:uncharacterized protein SAPINGB_P005121 [Magnusiomyces paraingens]|uniref:Major facilitator superfamily (MFS) profile domain-containing protein n=1 Tax=Magnusiomyces paraingens TaxID=2606893 RepID=A0A5E8BZH5_9ASCO|nr:uncharacterized protein SAPINGB_P005121 [Saprochaete ingens]VVT56512.1 unnamed protein product [Saprochaete ingens]
MSRILTSFSQEIGLDLLASSSRDVLLLIFIKIARMLAFGMSSIFLVQFFNVHGYPDDRTGFFMSCTLIGDVIISYFLTMNADRIGRRLVLCVGALLMVASGIVFALSNNFYILLAAAVFGVISPSGADIGPFKAVEESTLAHLVPPDHRNDIYAWYSLASALAAAAGNISGGWIVHYLMSNHLQLSELAAYKVVFVIFSLLGALKFLFSLFLTHRVESDDYLSSKSNIEPTENTSLLESPTDTTSQTTKKKFSLLPELSSESVKIVIQLSCLFAMDSFGSSLVQLSWISYYITSKFHINPEILGTAFFITGFIGAFTMLISSSIAKRLGPVLTMALTHFPSSFLIIFIPMPSTFLVTFIILIVRSCTSQMDVAPRQAFLSMVVRSSERTAVMGWVNVVKTCSQVFGPTIAGYLASLHKQWVCFILAGTLKVTYDALILLTFALKDVNREHS